MLYTFELASFDLEKITAVINKHVDKSNIVKIEHVESNEAYLHVKELLSKETFDNLFNELHSSFFVESNCLVND